MTLLRLFASFAKRQKRCFCGEPGLHRGCLNDAFERFLDELERAAQA